MLCKPKDGEQKMFNQVECFPVVTCFLSAQRTREDEETRTVAVSDEILEFALLSFEWMNQMLSLHSAVKFMNRVKSSRILPGCIATQFQPVP